MTISNEHYMQLVLSLAAKGRLSVSPNPMVGCVIVKNNQIVGQGFHQKAGEAHAEILALREAGSNAKSSTVYVNLEPCCHQGKTPPCTTALINAGIKKAVIATRDPNPLVSGNGIKILNNAGIETEVGLYKKEASELNEIFFHSITTKKPFVIAKWAMSLDGKTITNKNDDRHISLLETQSHFHELRQQVDAIIVGAETIRKDNPLLTARRNDINLDRQPLRIILTQSGNLSLDSQIFSSDLPGKTIVVTTAKTDKNKLVELENNNIETIILPTLSNNQIDLNHLLIELDKKNISSALIEGGMTTLESFFEAKLVNKIYSVVSPVIIGKSQKKQGFHLSNTKTIGTDTIFSAYPGENYV